MQRVPSALAFLVCAAAACGGPRVSTGSVAEGARSPNFAERNALALGTETACTLDDGHRLQCYGRYAQELRALDAVVQIAVGDGVGCARTAAQHLVCWGVDGLAGETSCFAGLPVVYPDAMPPNTPRALAATCPPREVPFDAVGAVWVGSTVGCAQLMGGEVRCWGGQVIEAIAPTDGAATRPRRVPMLEVALRESGVAFALADDHGCVVRADGSVSCVGRNEQGQLGNGGAADASRFVLVDGLVDVHAVRVAEGRSCALERNGSVSCWGNRGLDNPEIDRRPVRVGMPEPLVTLALSRLSGCGRAASGQVLCWGATFRGRIGFDSGAAVRALVPVPQFAGASDIATGIAYSCAVQRAGLRCTGDVPSAAVDELAPYFVGTTPAPATLDRVVPANVDTRCVADADCVLGGPGCCEPCSGWRASELVAFHRNATESYRARVCSEPMSCAECAVPAPRVDARCIERVCQVVERR